MLRVLALPGERLWTPEPLPADALPALDLLPAPTPCSGALPADGPRVPWAVVPGLDDHRARPAPAPCPELPLVHALRRAPRPTLDVQRAVTHRRFGTTLAAELAALVGPPPAASAWLTSVETLTAHLAGPAAGLDAWVLKAPFSAAGEGLAVHAPERPLGSAARRAAFARHGELLFEAWEPRLADLGASGWIDAEGAVHLVGVHRQRCDARGGFRAVERPADPGPADTARSAHATLTEVLREVGARLAAAGHRGPFGVDAYLRAGPDGPALRALVELNPRLGFGHLLHALAERATAAGALPPGAPLRLVLGGPDRAPPPGAWPLVRPVGGRGLNAWAEVPTSRSDEPAAPPAARAAQGPARPSADRA